MDHLHQPGPLPPPRGPGSMTPAWHIGADQAEQARRSFVMRLRDDGSGDLCVVA